MTHAHTTYNLRDLLSELVERYPDIQEAVLFGSRNYGTQSDRSDVDIILRHQGHIKPAELRNLTQEICPALDLFLCRDNTAVSCANESCVTAETYERLIERLHGKTLWSTHKGFNEDFVDWEFQIPQGVSHEPTAALLSFDQYESWAPRIRDFMKGVAASGFPTTPFIGVTARDAATVMVTALRGAVTELPDLDKRGDSSVIRLRNEYDFQNLFRVICKSWLPGLAREEVTIHYDSQDKKADFNFLRNSIVFEFKHVKDANTKAAVVKALSGLTEFYLSHPNISILVNVVLVDVSVQLDDRRWEEDYSDRSNIPEVWTTIIRNNT